MSVRITTYESTLVNGEKYIGWTFIKQRSWSQSWIQRNLETKAATILQFFAGLPGTLAVTFEEGTWSAWLYDLLHSRVDKLVVCNPPEERAAQRREQERPHRCAQAGRSVTRQPTQTRLPRGDGRAHVARTIAESHHRQRPVAGEESAESGVSQLGDSLCRKRRLLRPASSSVAGKNPRSRGAASHRTTL